MFKQRKIYFFSILSAVLLMLPTVAKAIQFTNPLAHADAENQSLGLNSLVGRFIQGILLIAGVLATGFIVKGGIRIILARGKDEEVKQGRMTLVWAIIGLVVAFGGYVFVNAVLDRVGGLIGGK